MLYFYNKISLFVVGLFQSSLFNDIPEMNKETEFIRTTFTGIATDLSINVHLKDASSLYGLINFLRQIDPQLQRLAIILPDDITILHFRQLSEAIKNLSKNVSWFVWLNYKVNRQSKTNFAFKCENICIDPDNAYLFS